MTSGRWLRRLLCTPLAGRHRLPVLITIVLAVAAAVWWAPFTKVNVAKVASGPQVQGGDPAGLAGGDTSEDSGEDPAGDEPADDAEDEDGEADPAVAPLHHGVATDEPVVFITVDDGWTPSPELLRLVRSGLPVTAFLTGEAARLHPHYYQALAAAGANMQNHGQSHAELGGRAIGFQREEICDGAATVTRVTGRVPTIFRSPYGSMDGNTLVAAKACGAKAVVHWTAEVKRGQLILSGSETKLRPGDVILLHFDRYLNHDLHLALDAARRAGLRVAPLERYLPGTREPVTPEHGGASEPLAAGRPRR